MGKYGQAILTIAGTIVGAYFGYPALGAALGSLAGSLLFPTQLPTVSGPRLSDLTQTTSAVGTYIPRGWGTFPVAGCVMYQSDLREVIQSEDVGGKGGSSQTVETPTYYQDFAIALCEGEDPIANLGPIAGVRRIWANGKLIYDRTARRGEENVFRFNHRMASSEALAQTAVLYLGTEDQEPDPTMEAGLGIGEVSAFRGLAYMVFTNWQNKPEDGNKMPMNWKFEVYTDGAVTDESAYEYSNEYLPPWNTASSDVPLWASSTFYSCKVNATGWTFGSGRAGAGGKTYTTFGAAYNHGNSVALRTAANNMGYCITPNSGAMSARGVTNKTPGGETRTVAGYDPWQIAIHFNCWAASKFGRGGSGLAGMMEQGLAPGVRVHTNGYFLNMGNFSAASAGVYHWWTNDYASGAAYRSSSDLIDFAISTGRSNNPGAVLITGDLIIGVTRKVQPPGDQCRIDLPNMPGYCVSTRGNLIRRRSWQEYTSGSMKVLQSLVVAKVQIGGESINHQVDSVRKYPLNPALPNGHELDTQAYWEAAYASAVASGLMAPGLTYGVDYPVSQTRIYRRPIDQQWVETDRITVAQVVGDLMRESGYSTADYDVSGLAGLTTMGFVRTRAMNGRAAIEPIRQAKFFDGIESNGKIKFVRRGGPIVASLTDDELGYAVAGEDAPSKLSTTNTDETTLPRSVRVHYLAFSRDYEPGEQPSPARIDTRATNDLDVEIAMVMEDDEAAQVAQVLWAEAWTSRKTHQAVIDGGRQELEPTDPIEVPVDGKLRRMRILSIEDAFPSLRRLELVRDDTAQYISHAVGTTPVFTRPALDVPSPAELILLDLPALRDEDDDAGVYAAVAPYMTDAPFRGATILRSVDNGASYSSLGPVGTGVSMGTLLSAVPTALYTIWDELTVLRVFMQYGELESRTEDAVLAGANAAAIGAHSRWEIVQFRDAVYAGDGVWVLSGLLRGRRGTEHNIGLAELGDRFVMLSAGGLVRLTMSTSEVGAPRMYKAVAFGTNFADATAQTFTGNGEALRPFSPVHLSVAQEDDDDMRLTWIRRGRLGQTLQSGIDIPLSEATEAYEVDVVIDGEVVRTIETTEQAATYTAIQQAVDFNSPAPVAVTFRVYQISATVGRGHVGELIVDLAGLNADFPDVEVIPDDVESPDVNAIIVPLTFDEFDQAAVPLTWTKSGTGPRVTPLGMLGDGYEARLRATAGLPGYATSNSGPLYLRATIAPYDGSRNATRDLVVAVCVNDATANARLAFAVVDDATAANVPVIACRSYTGSQQSQRLFRRDWRFCFTQPIKSSGGFAARPTGLVHTQERTLVATHFQGNFSIAQGFDPLTGTSFGYFEFPSGSNVVSAAAAQESGPIWFAVGTTKHILQIDIDESFATYAAVVVADVDFSALGAIAGIEWVTIVDEDTEEESEYLLIAEGLSSGTPYLYVFAAADVVNGEAPAVGERLKRITLPLETRGIAYKEGFLYVATGETGGGTVRAFAFDLWLELGADGAAYSTYAVTETWRPATQCGQDISFDDSGNLMNCTEGEVSPGDDDAFLAVWASPLTSITGTPIGNNCSAYYSSGSVQIRMNDKPFATKSWTPTPTPGAISIGGPPQAAAGQLNGFFIGHVRNVIVQGTDYNPADFEDITTYEEEGNLEPSPLTIENAGAEQAATVGWTTEAGTLTVRTANPLPHTGAGYFTGGADLHTKARQRLDLATMIEFDITRLDAGDCQIMAEWWGAGFSSQDDTNSVGFRFLNAAVATISETLAPGIGMSPTDIWLRRSYGVTIPTGTRYVEIILDMVRNSGTNNDGYIDDIGATIYVPVLNE